MLATPDLQYSDPVGRPIDIVTHSNASVVYMRLAPTVDGQMPARTETIYEEDSGVTISIDRDQFDRIVGVEVRNTPV